jgi:hypothetical protein
MTTTIENMKQSIHLNIPNTNTIDVSVIYSRIFFDIFFLKGYRVYIMNKNQQTLVNTPKPIDIGKPEFSDILGEEQPNNGYDVLPVTQNNNKSIHNEIGAIDTFKQYVTNFLGKTNTAISTDKPFEGIMISFPNSLTRSIISLDDLYNNLNSVQESIFQFSKSDITYESIENILRDLYIQINYLKQIGMTYQNITTKSIYRIQERFILLDSSLLEPLKTDTISEQTQRLNQAIVSLFSEIIGYKQTDKLDFYARFTEIQDTRVYYVLKRMEFENVFEWI